MEVFERFKERLARTGANRSVTTASAHGEPDELRFSRLRSAEELRRENARLNGECERLNGRLQELEKRLELLPARVNPSGNDNSERASVFEQVRVLTGERDGFVEKLKATKRSLGKLVAQSRLAERRAQRAEEERDALRAQLQQSLLKEQRSGDSAYAVKAYLLQLQKVMHGVEEPDSLRHCQSALNITVKDETLKRLLTSLLPPAPHTAREPSIRNSVVKEHSNQLRAHFLRLRVNHLRNERINIQELKAAEAAIYQSIEQIDEYLDGLGEENLRLDYECRRLQLASI
mmetsp:Transcript_155/g.474  ORF Transcript_155/g.474 Transcript_155/m.474 type:complete len:289 (+) Transcript_155:221-1087(+)